MYGGKDYQQTETLPSGKCLCLGDSWKVIIQAGVLLWTFSTRTYRFTWFFIYFQTSLSKTFWLFQYHTLNQMGDWQFTKENVKVVNVTNQRFLVLVWFLLNGPFMFTYTVWFCFLVCLLGGSWRCQKLFWLLIQQPSNKVTSKVALHLFCICPRTLGVVIYLHEFNWC